MCVRKLQMTGIHCQTEILKGRKTMKNISKLVIVMVLGFVISEFFAQPVANLNDQLGLGPAVSLTRN